MITKTRIASLFAGMMLLAFASESVAAGGIKIAYVDLARAMQETNEGKAELKMLEKKKNKLQVKIEKKEKTIKNLQDTIKKQQSILDQATLQKKMEEYYQLVAELQQEYMQFQKELTANEMKVQQKLYKKMYKILEQIGKSEGYTMIYDRSVGAVVWAPSHLDLTDKLIQAYNRAHKAKK